MEEISRRAFLRGGAVLAAGAASAAALSGCAKNGGAAEDGGASPERDHAFHTYEADVIVVGGGMSGLTAARRIIAEGRTIAIVDKGRYGHSGASGINWGHSLSSLEFNPDKTYPQTFAAGLSFASDGVVDQAYLAATAAAWQEISPIRTSVQMGCVTEHAKDGTPKCGNAPAPETGQSGDAGMFPRMYAQQVKKIGAHVHDHTFALDILTASDGSASGVAAIDLITGEPCVFRGKAVIIATGSYVWLCGWNGISAYSHSSADCTGDGAAMFMRAGLAMRDMEEICQDNGQWEPAGTRQCMTGMGVELPDHYRGFNNNYETFSQMILDDPATYMNQGTYMRLTMREIWQGRGTEHGGIWANTDGLEDEERYYRPAKWNMKRIFDYDLPQFVELVPQAWETAGRPFALDPSTCQTEIPGLFYAGGAPNVWNGFVIASCMGSGWLSGKAAADRAAGSERPEIDSEQVGRIFDESYGLLESEPAQPIRARTLMRDVQNAFWDGMYFLRDEKGIQGTIDELTRIMRDDLPRIHVPDKSRQYNPEWRFALEARNMITVGIGAAQAALIRRESRGAHCRTDYPKVDNANYIANTKVRVADDSWSFELVPIDGPLVSHDALVQGVPQVGID